MPPIVDSIKLFIQLTRPIFLIGVAIMYALGVGIARFLGADIDWVAYLLGQVWVSTLQLSTQYLNEYFNAPADIENPNRTFLTGGSGAIGTGKLPRRVALIAGLVCLATLAYFTIILITQLQPGIQIYLIMVLAFFGSFFYSTPPIRLEATGYGELTTSILVTFLVPAFAFILQMGEIHRLVAVSAFPLMALHLAMLLSFELPDYPTDLKFSKKTMMVRMGWKNGMMVHDILIFCAYLMIVLAASIGYPRSIMFPAMLSLPMGIFQVWQMRSIANGAKPNWNLLTTGALALFGLMSYLMTFAFWVN